MFTELKIFANQFIELILFSAPLLEVSCPDGWTESTQSGTCIKLYEEKMSWDKARGECQANDADLVKIGDKTMNEFIWGKTNLNDFLASQQPETE